MSVFLVDSHAHLDFDDFRGEEDALIARAKANGVGLVVTISTFVSRLPALLAIAERQPDVFASVGTHPHNAGVEPDIAVAEIVRLAQHPKIVAIGEAGLDYHYDKAPRDVQATVFRRHIEAARETGLPLVIHARDADADMEAILREEAGKGAFPFILHCFSSTRRLAEVGLDLGGTISFSGILAFNRSDELRAIAVDVPLDRLLVETDAPFLAPPPFRGKRNEPAYVRHTAEVLARVKGIELEELARATSDNFFHLFAKVPDPRSERSAA